jgi:hypothetical protein
MLAPALSRLTDAVEAGRLMTALAHINESWHQRAGQSNGAVIRHLRDASGDARAAFPVDATETGPVGGQRVTQQPVNGRAHWFVMQPAGLWRVVIAEPAEPLAPLLWRLADDILDKLLRALHWCCCRSASHGGLARARCVSSRGRWSLAIPRACNRWAGCAAVSNASAASCRRPPKSCARRWPQ